MASININCFKGLEKAIDNAKANKVDFILTGGDNVDIDVLKKAGANWPIIGHIDGTLAFQSKNYEKAQ